MKYFQKLIWEHDEKIAKDNNLTIEQVREYRKSAYKKIREGMKKRGHKDIPDTDEALFLYMERLGVFKN